MVISVCCACCCLQHKRRKVEAERRRQEEKRKEREKREERIESGRALSSDTLAQWQDLAQDRRVSSTYTTSTYAASTSTY